MKLLRSTIFAAGMMASFSSFAAVDVDFDVAIEPLLINGEEVSSFATQMTKAELDDGPNQMVVRVSKLIRKNGVYTKFKSEPLVVTFDATNVGIKVEPGKKFSSAEQVGDFQTNPTLKITQADGRLLDTHIQTLPRGKGLVRDFGEELAAYNMANDYTFTYSGNLNSVGDTVVETSSKDANLPKSDTKVASEQSGNVQVSLRETVKVEALKGQFKSLTPTQKKEFLSWAIMQ